MNQAAIKGFKRRDDIKYSGIQIPVYVSETGSQPVIVLHELPGMTCPFIDFCQKLVSEGYRVYMPLIFGEPRMKMGNVQMAKFCLSREFRHLFKMNPDTPEGRPFPRWLLHLTQTVIHENPGSDVGVIGMCLTGGFAIAAIANQGVGAVVSCQPAFPFFFGIRTIGLTKNQRDNCAKRCVAAPEPLVKGYRYSGDVLSREPHMRSIQNLLGAGFERHPDLKGCGHSTVTGPDPGKSQVIDDILKFLAHRLR